MLLRAVREGRVTDQGSSDQDLELLVRSEIELTSTESMHDAQGHGNKLQVLW